jgi:hypothetical protein
LRRVVRHIEQARADPPLEEFWRGVERDYEEDAHRIAHRVGEEALRLARIES